MLRDIALVIATFALATASGAEVPRDFALHAHLAPGGGPGSFDATVETHPKSWDLKLAADGTGRRVVGIPALRGNTLDVKHVKQRVSVPAASLAELVSAVDRASFFSLPHEVASECVEHTGGTYLSITMRGHTHEVSSCSLPMREDTQALKRFGGIWKALLRMCPSPNQNKELACFTSGPHGL
jgi:hypothetical protein